MTPDLFWSSTVAQLAACLPETPPMNQGSGSDLLALAEMTN